jgi:hypothetical protein
MPVCCLHGCCHNWAAPLLMYWLFALPMRSYVEMPRCLAAMHTVKMQRGRRLAHCCYTMQCSALRAKAKTCACATGRRLCNPFLQV